MSILIKGMEMPKNCAECFFHKVFPAKGVGINELYCALCGINIVKLGDAQPDCPLVHVPPHGALMDRDSFFATCPELVDGYKTITDDFVVIPEEEEPNVPDS